MREASSSVCKTVVTAFFITVLKLPCHLGWASIAGMCFATALPYNIVKANIQQKTEAIAGFVREPTYAE
jgi:hypothetical protein